jgi:hypothetical protein
MTGVTVVAVLGGAMAIAAASCTGEDQSAAAQDAGADAKKITAPSDAGTTNPLDATDTTPYYNSDGWVGLQGFDRACGIYVAPSPSAKNFPPPIAWGPCDARVHGVDGGALVCRQISGGTGFVGSAYVNRATQAVTLPILQARDKESLNMVVEADGPVHQAFVTLPPRCGTDTFSSVSASSVVYTLDELSSDLSQVILDGALGGGIDQTPHMLRVYSTVDSVGYVAGTNEFAEYGAAGFDTGSWVDGHRIDSITASGSGQNGELQFQADNLFFGVNDLTYGRVELFHTGAPTLDFISFGNDTQSYAADFGTDGTDMVWSEAFGHPSDAAPWTTINIVTAPYTTNPVSITKRRLRSETITPGAQKFVVGCGYAAHETATAQAEGVRIVRLSDGQSWLFLNSASPLLTWNAPIAITCTEIFINFNFGAAAQNLARIRLDSLGPGDAAD